MNSCRAHKHLNNYKASPRGALAPPSPPTLLQDGAISIHGLVHDSLALSSLGNLLALHCNLLLGLNKTKSTTTLQTASFFQGLQLLNEHTVLEVFQVSVSAASAAAVRNRLEHRANTWRSNT